MNTTQSLFSVILQSTDYIKKQLKLTIALQENELTFSTVMRVVSISTV